MENKKQNPMVDFRKVMEVLNKRGTMTMKELWAEGGFTSQDEAETAMRGLLAADMATFDCLGGERNYYLTFKGEDQLRNPSMKLRPIASMNGRSKAMPCLLATGENGRLVIQGECVCKEAYFILDMGGYCSAQGMVGERDFTDSDYGAFLRRAGMTEDDMNGFFGVLSGKSYVGKLVGYAYRAESIKPADPTEAASLFKSKFCVRMMTKAPADCRFAYLKKGICLNEAIRRAVHGLPYLADEQGEYEAQKVLVLPIGPRSSHEMVDGTNDLIVSKTRIAGAGIKFK